MYFARNLQFIFSGNIAKLVNGDIICEVRIATFNAKTVFQDSLTSGYVVTIIFLKEKH